MSNQEKPSKRAADELSSEASENQLDDPANDPFVAELYARYVAGEITVEEAVELARAEALQAVRSRLTDAEYADLEEFMHDVQLPHEDELRRRQRH